MNREDIASVFNVRISEIVDGDLDGFSPDAQLVQEVYVRVGPDFGTVAIGETQTSNFTAYAKGERELPLDKRGKLALMKTVGDLISSLCDNETTRTFLRGANPILGDKAAIELIYEAEPEELPKVARDIGNAALAFVFG